MTVYELNKYELEELKEAYFYDNNGDCQSEKVELFAEFYQRIFFEMIFPVLLWAIMICIIIMYA